MQCACCYLTCCWKEEFFIRLSSDVELWSARAHLIFFMWELAVFLFSGYDE